MTKDEFQAKFNAHYEKYLKHLDEEISKRLESKSGKTLSTNEIIIKLFYLNLEISTKFLYETISEFLDLDD